VSQLLQIVLIIKGKTLGIVKEVLFKLLESLNYYSVYCISSIDLFGS